MTWTCSKQNSEWWLVTRKMWRVAGGQFSSSLAISEAKRFRNYIIIISIFLLRRRILPGRVFHWQFLGGWTSLLSAGVHRQQPNLHLHAKAWNGKNSQVRKMTVSVGDQSHIDTRFQASPFHLSDCILLVFGTNLLPKYLNLYIHSNDSILPGTATSAVQFNTIQVLTFLASSGIFPSSLLSLLLCNFRHGCLCFVSSRHVSSEQSLIKILTLLLLCTILFSLEIKLLREKAGQSTPIWYGGRSMLVFVKLKKVCLFSCALYDLFFFSLCLTLEIQNHIYLISKNKLRKYMRKVGTIFAEQANETALPKD